MVKYVHYDPKVDILYIVLKEGPVEDTIEANEDVFIELGRNGEIIGIEIWRASKNIVEPISKVLASRVKELIHIKH
jgi:uncharacterized protein YuzE